ncbi:MAG: STAS/SEC14 domain-containing protein [Defluviicoccus sp.]|nr:STAS/SEC14 domain-containing protein [Defluviicoccus sp.]MDG4593166.1 STAS/SEC14 domain-containing protein [Defluviicoccus sp.]MDS4072889.1 STAS/SEC14 domain-containing protein [Defluviicoccus sp.]
MIEVLPLTKDRVIALKMANMISEAEIDHCAEAIGPLLDDERRDFILLDWSELEGWEAGAKSVGTQFGMKSWASVVRIAIVAEPKWEDEQARIADVFRAATVRRFPPSQRDKAIAWLTAEDTATA